MVRETGLEPAHPCGRQPLKLMRLPISPLAHKLVWEPPNMAGPPPICQRSVDEALKFRRSARN